MTTTPNIPLFKPNLAPETALMPRLQEVLYGGQISEGQPVYDFEDQFVARFGLPNALSFYSGTAALHTALILANVGAGDEVISTPMTAEPTNLAILHAGASVVWADVNPANGNISPESVAAKISPKTKAVMAVHYGGVPVALAALQRIADQHGLALIEDCAHALGARYAGKPIGSTSAYSMFSLQAIKHMTTVDGGMLVCRDADQLARGRRIRWFGMDRRTARDSVDIAEVGYKYHMNNVNATIGLVQLEFIGSVISRHVENGQYLDKELSTVQGLDICTWEDQAEPSYWFYTVLAEQRDDLAQYLTEQGIGCSTAHRRNDLHSVFASSRTNLPGLDTFWSRMLHIPCGWWVGDEDRHRIVEALSRGW